MISFNQFIFPMDFLFLFNPNCCILIALKLTNSRKNEVLYQSQILGYTHIQCK